MRVKKVANSEHGGRSVFYELRQESGRLARFTSVQYPPRQRTC
jgi:hypothetical protein